MSARQSGDMAGNWLTREQARDLLARPESDTIEGKRDRAILAVLLGCACAAASSRRSSRGTSSSATTAGYLSTSCDRRAWSLIKHIGQEMF